MRDAVVAGALIYAFDATFDWFDGQHLHVFVRWRAVRRNSEDECGHLARLTVFIDVRVVGVDIVVRGGRLPGLPCILRFRFAAVVTPFLLDEGVFASTTAEPVAYAVRS